jgi:hypothetical protein
MTIDITWAKSIWPYPIINRPNEDVYAHYINYQCGSCERTHLREVLPLDHAFRHKDYQVTPFRTAEAVLGSALHVMHFAPQTNCIGASLGRRDLKAAWRWACRPPFISWECSSVVLPVSGHANSWCFVSDLLDRSSLLRACSCGPAMYAVVVMGACGCAHREQCVALIKMRDVDIHSR